MSYLVPVFDGRFNLNFNRLRDCCEYRRELQPGAAVVPIFTIHMYHPYGSQLSRYPKISKTDSIVSFNLRGLIYLKDPNPGFTHKHRVNARDEALGVKWPPVRGDSIKEEGESGKEPKVVEKEEDPFSDGVVRDVYMR